MDSVSHCSHETIEEEDEDHPTSELSATLTLLSFAAHGQGKPVGKEALLYFVWPQNGATIKDGFWCRSEPKAPKF
jgi:hypothetical protein